ncbi:MAG: tripartite tricarboxylate transporter substrate binding protein [Alphaproteobacteria bacterium]|nr:tripartite tricarboxylate transporter substrate binding protein [Alphaproteobacteria bacterium]
MMKMTVVLAAIGVIALNTAPRAQDAYPNRVVRLIVPFAPGGNTDVVARITAEYMAKALKASVVVENRVGAGGLTGTDMAAKSPADGYTLCVCGVGPIAVSPHTEKLPYDSLKDFAPISLVNTNPVVLLVNPKLNVQTAKELVELSRNTPGGMNYGTGGVGGLTHFAAEVLRVRNQLLLTTVPYRGAALATAAIVSGEVPFGFVNMSDAIAQLSAGTVRAVAVTTGKRSPSAPQIPTLIEQGLVDFPIESWNGLLAPAGTPKPIIDRLAAVMAEMSKDPAHQKRLADIGSIAVASTPNEFEAVIREDTRQWGKALRDIGVVK